MRWVDYELHFEIGSVRAAVEEEDGEEEGSQQATKYFTFKGWRPEGIVFTEYYVTIK